MVAERTRKRRQTGGSSAPVPTHHVRSRNDPADWLLPRDRKLFAAFLRTAAGRGAADVARLPPQRSFAVPGRKPPDHPAIARDVSWRPFAQTGAGQLWFSPAQRDGQSSAHF